MPPQSLLPWSVRHTIAVGAEGRYLVVLVEAIGLAEVGLEVLMVAWVVIVVAGLSLVQTLLWANVLERRSAGW